MLILFRIHKNNIYLSHNLIHTKLGKKKEEKKEKKRLKNELSKVFLNDERIASNCSNCKSSCCEKYMKSESKRCSRCPMYDLIKKIA